MRTLGDLACYALDGSGNAVWFLPGAEVPGWAEKQMGDHCFASSGGHAHVAAEPADDEDEDYGEDGDDLAVPPQSGPGSGVGVWRDYAAAHEVDVDGLKKADIIAALEEAGVPVE